jgi:isoquinoline 1-oxidoreductase beta subunit
MDAAPKVDGSAIYPIDVRIPGMVYAAVRACPVPGGKVAKFDAEAVKSRPGVIAVVELRQTKQKLANTDLRSAVAVVADSFYRAKTALDLLPIEWDLGPGATVSTSGLTAQANKLLGETSQHAEAVRGDPQPLLAAASAGKRVTGDYARPYETHAPLCPPAAVANVTPERVELWSFTQNAALTLNMAADQAGREVKDVFLNGTFQGGAFGSGLGMEIARQAVEISKQVGKPVKVVWTREEDTLQSKARPPIWARFDAALGDDGLPTALLTRAVAEPQAPAYADRGLSTPVYAIPHVRYERHQVTSHMPAGPNRAPGFNNNGFAIEQFADELALAGGWDPLDWRLKMTAGNEPWQRVLTKLKEVSGFTTKLPKGRGMGIAVVESHGSVVGACATVAVSKRGALTVEKVLLVANCGWLINPRGAREQLQGSVGWELSHALYGGLNIENGRFTNTNFDNYQLLRISEMPDVEVVFTLSQDKWWGGIGEPGVPPTPPAVANAIYFATGRRVRQTPFIKQDLSWT